MKKNKQAGFTAIEALLIILLLIGAASGGYYVWKSKQKSYKKPSSSSSSSYKKPASSKAAKAVSYVTLNDWGVRFKPADGLNYVTYYKITDKDWLDSNPGVEGYEFSTKDIEALGGSCSYDSEEIFTSVAGIWRSKQKLDVDTWHEPDQQINGYYYYSAGGNAYCGPSSDNNDKIQTPVRQKFIESFKTLESVK